MRATRGLILLLVSSLLAWVSLESTRKMAILEYRVRHPLPWSAWHALLGRKGYRLLDDPRLLSSALRPDAPMNEGEIRISPDRNLLLFPERPPEEGLTLWGRNSDPPPKGEWTSASFSLDGFEALAAWPEVPAPAATPEPEASPRPPPPRPKGSDLPRTARSVARRTGRKAKWIDPKAIHY